jgi:hypothetical protein
MRTKSILLFAIMASTVLLTIKCKKNPDTEKLIEADNQNPLSPAMTEKVLAFQNENTKNGIKVLDYNSDVAGVKSRVENVKQIASVTTSGLGNVVCNGIDGTISSNLIQVTYNGTCNSVGNYTAENVKIKLILPTGSTLINTTNIPVKIKYGTVILNKTANVTSTSSGGNISLLSVADFLLNDYCSINTLDIVCSIQVQCSDGSISSGDVVCTNNILSFRNDICKHISPVFIQPIGSGSVSLNGWIICTDPAFSPCMSYANAVEFSYRKLGTSTFTTYILSPYLGNAHVVSGLSSGTYEFMNRNIQYVSAGSNSILCWSPSTNLKTVVIY